ncbi:hypothetical protein K2X05_08060 [bacterium]|nr:hypothetical protein [bacterium]
MKPSILYLWKSTALNPESAISEKYLDLSSLSIEDALIVAYPELSFCSLIEVLKRIEHSIVLDASKVFANYGFLLDSKLSHLLKIIPQFPPSFWQWCQKHSLSPRDLFPLLSLNSPQEISQCLEKFAEFSISRSLGAQILELSVECYLTTGNEALLIADIKNGDQWLQYLKTLRFPNTVKSDLQKEKELLSLPWTKDLNTRWLRQGDRSGLEIRFFASNQKELLKHVQQLQNIITQVETNTHDSP